MVRKPTWEQERSVSPPALRRLGRQPQDVDREQPAAVRRGSGERKSERFVVLEIPWQQNHGGGKGPYLVCVGEGGTCW